MSQSHKTDQPTAPRARDKEVSERSEQQIARIGYTLADVLLARFKIRLTLKAPRKKCI